MSTSIRMFASVLIILTSQVSGDDGLSDFIIRAHERSHYCINHALRNNNSMCVKGHVYSSCGAE